MSPTPPTERVGRYQLLEPIGLGPSGSVSRAKVFGVAGFERQFAVKRFHAELTTTAAMAAMLSAAARAYGSLEHPRIARMSEFGVAQGATFTAVEYVAGLDALRLIAEARLTGVALAAGGVLALVSQAARAVGYAHGRGLTHLGLAPTNVILTAEGDVKITDFGILSATLPQRPVEISRLANRIPYLAPEQLANEATSAATDVFALGVLAYELVTGNRTFRGDTPQQVAAAIMAGPPGELALPRPIVRVLQRCLARSPFERFPDARAFADALDAALRVAPVPGTRKDLGAQVKDVLDRFAALHEGQGSGVVAMFAGTGPTDRAGPDPGRAPTIELLDPPPPSPSPARTMPDLLRPMTTVPGLPPPPIPVPPGTAEMPPPAPPSLLAAPPLASTLVGMGKAPTMVPTMVPTIRPRTGSAAGLPARPPAVPPAVVRPSAARSTDLAIPIEPASPAARIRAASEAEDDLAVHTLDPSDILSFDGDDNASDEPPELEEPPPHPGRVATEVDPPVRDTARTKPSPRLDPGTVETRPIAPILLEPLLFDPIGRDEGAGALHAPHAPPAAPEDAPAAQPTGDEPAPGQAMEASGPAAADASPAGSTMRGISASPPRTPAATVAIAADPAEPGDDDLPGMLNEGFIPGPPHAEPAWPSDTGTPPPSLYSPSPIQPLPRAPEVDEYPPDGATLSRVPDLAAGWPAPPSADPDALGAPHPAPAGRPLWIAVGLLGAVIVGVSLWEVYRASEGAPGIAKAPPRAAAPRDAARAILPPVAPPAVASAAALSPADAALPPVDAAVAATEAAAQRSAKPDVALPDAPAAVDASRIATALDASLAPEDAARPPPVAEAEAARADAGATPIPALAATAPGQALAIASTPPGARVFLDGADTGATPLSLPGTPDRHTIALLLAGHELYVAQVDGHGTFQIPLKEITPTNGPAGIKVLRCKDKDRYYVFVDGKPTGQTCPTERIGCEVGPHTVEIYDVVSETRRKWDVVVKDTRLSLRVRVE